MSTDPPEKAADPAGPTPGGLRERTRSAAQWRLSASLVEGLLQLGVGIVLARLLPPRDFGLLALALIVVGLSRLVANLGIAASIIQRRDLSPRHVRVAFTLASLLGLGIASLLAALAPLAATLLGSAAVSSVLRVISLVFVANGLGNTAGALLRRELRFRELFSVSLTAYLLGYTAVAVPLALLDCGVWSLVAGLLGQAAVESALLLALARHPLRPLLARREMREIAGYGIGFSVHNFVEYLAGNADRFVVGRLLGAAPLGFYTRAHGLMRLPQDHFGQIARTVLFPAFAEAQRDPRRVAWGYLQATQLTAMVALPLMIGMGVAAPHLIVGLYGEKWREAVLPLQILCAAGFFRAGYPLALSVAYGTGRIYGVLPRTFAFAVLVAAGTALGARFGLPGVAAGVGLALACAYGMTAAFTLRIVRATWGEFAAAHAPGVFLGIPVAATAIGTRAVLETLGAGSLLSTLVLCVACGLAVCAGLYGIPERWRPRELFDELRAPLSVLPPRPRGWAQRLLRSG